MRFGNNKEIPKELHRMGYKIPLYPNEEQKEFLNRCIDINRFMYNWVIEQENIQLEKFNNKEDPRKFLNFRELSSMFTKMRYELSFLQDVPYSTGKSGIKRASKAFDKFFNNKTGRPKFKSKKLPHQSFDTVSNRMYFEDNMLKIQGLKSMIQTKYHTGLNRHFNLFINPVISRDNIGNYYISFSILEPKPLEYFDKNNIKPLGRAIGIDLNVKKRFVLSTGEIFYGPDLSRELVNLRTKQSRVSKDINRRKNMERTNPSKNCQSKRAKKREIQYQKQSKRIVNITENFIQQTTKKIINMRPKAIVMEDIDANSILANHNIAKHTYHANFGRCIEVMKRKADKYDIPFMQAAKDYPSTQLCSSCGNRQEMKLWQKTYRCPHCGLVIDRDINAALNLEHLAYC